MSRLTPHNPLGRQQPGSGTPDTCCPGQRAFGTPGVAVKHAPPARGTIAPHAFSEVEESVLFENVNIGRYARIRRCIVDKDVDIPQGISIGYDLEEDRRRFYVSESGIVVIPKRAKLG